MTYHITTTRCVVFSSPLYVDYYAAFMLFSPLELTLMLILRCFRRQLSFALLFAAAALPCHFSLSLRFAHVIV